MNPFESFDTRNLSNRVTGRANFKPFGKGNKCSVCGEEDSACRYNANEPDFIQCHHFADARKGEKVNGFICIKESNGHTASFKPDNSQEWTEEQRQQWANEQRRRLEKSHREEKHRLDQLLPIPERDTQYRRIVTNLGLNQKHRISELSERRGLNAEEIDFAVDQNWLCSWQPGTEVKEVSPRLAGINPTGIRRTLLGVSGIGIAAIDSTGSIGGFQIGSDNREKFGKYLWASSSSKNGSGPHLPSGELPIFVWRHPESTEITESWLVEGSLKSLITALKLWFQYGRKDIQVIGAAGANFNGSIGAVLEALQGKVTLCPDAGSLSNSHILHQYKSIIEVLTSKAYSVSVAWWGQLEKGKDPDIDELSDTLGFDLITPGEFFSLAKDAESKDENSDWAWRNWVKSRKFTPDITVNQQKFCYPKLPENNAIIGVHAGLGNYKTGATLDLIRSSSNRGFWFASLNVLLLQTGARAKENGIYMYHYQTEDGEFFLKDDSAWISLCPDSSPHIDGYFQGVDIVIDEAVSVLQSICEGGTLKDNQAKVIRLFTKMFRECNRIFLLDGNLADIHVDFIARISGKKSFKILNEAKIPPHKIKIVTGIDENGEIAKRDKSPLIKAMLDDNVKPWIASDSKTFTDKVHEIFRQAGKLGYVLNKDTSGEKWAKEFLSSPDDFITQNKPDNFIVSPTATSGLSIQSRNHFTDKFTFFTGVLGTNSEHQMLFRLRDDSIIHYIFCPERSMVKDRNNPGTYSAKKLSELLQERQIQSALLAADGTTSSMLKVIGDAISRSNDDWWAFSCQLGALDNFEMNNLRRCLIHVLKEAGHDVELVDWQTDDEVSELEKQAAEAVRTRYALELYQAIEFPDINEANKASKSNPGKNTQRRIEKTYLLDKLPGIRDTEKFDTLSSLWMMRLWLNILDLNSPVGMMFLYKTFPVWSPEFIADYYLKDRHFISQQQRFYMLQNFEISRMRSEVSWYYTATNQDYFLGQFKDDSHLTIWALQQINIMQFTSGEYHKDSDETVSVINALRERQDIAKALKLNLRPPTDDGNENIKILSGLLKRIGLKFAKPVQKLINGIKTRVYSIDKEEMQNPIRLAILEAIARKFDNYLESETVKKICWEETPVIEPVEEQAVVNTVAVDPVDKLPTVTTVFNYKSSSDINPEPAPITTDNLDSETNMNPELTENDFLTEVSLQDLADLMAECQDAEMLNDLRAIAPPSALKLAARRLPEQKRKLIRDWVVNTAA